jgi:predicted nucleic acid-binding protein
MKPVVLDASKAGELLADVLELPLDISPSEQLVGAALDLAMGTSRTAHDCLYVVLAVQVKAVLVRGDRRRECHGGLFQGNRT